jgi:hypothetical protein
LSGKTFRKRNRQKVCVYEGVYFERNKALIEDFTERTLAAIPSEFGRLLYISTLRDLATGRYTHAGLEERYSEGAVHEVLSGSHQEILTRILETPLEQQIVDLGRCLENMPGDRCELAKQWRELEFYRAMLPLGLPSYVRELFCSNLEALLSILETAEPIGLPAA